jgi:hypothetical protein
LNLKATIAFAVLGLGLTATTACSGNTPAAVAANGTVTTASSASTAARSGSVAGSGTPAPVAGPTSQAATQPQPVPSSSPTSVTISAAQPVVFDCLGHTQVRPGTYVFACADYGSLLEHMSWHTWSASSATGYGVHSLNNCTPNCAEGTFINYPVFVTFWRPEPVANHPGEKYFSRITVVYTTSARPPAYMNYNMLVKHPREWSEVLGVGAH